MVEVRVVAALLIVGCGGGGGGTAQPDASDDAPGSIAPDHGYFLLAPPRIAAKSTVRNLVRVIGTQVGGAPATDDLVLNVDRPDSGTYSSPVVTLGPLGATSTFSACDVATPGCTGPVTLTAALASAPTTPIASRSIEIVDPADVDPTKPCRGGGNVLYLKGNDQLLTGETTFTSATLTFTDDYNEYLVFSVTSPVSPDTWRLAFDLRGFGTAYMVPDTYERAVKSGAVVAGSQYYRPAMSISNSANACSTLTGRFEIVDNVRDGSGTSLLSVAFEQHCEGSATSVLTGCVHFER